MSLLIRSFINTDVQPLCRVAHMHYAAVGQSLAITPLTFELCVLAKVYFDPELLIVAELDHQVVGFMLLGFQPDPSLQSLNPTQATATCVMIAPHADEQTLAQELIAEAVRRLSARGARLIDYSPPPPSNPFLTGLSPADSMSGLPRSDIRQQSWFQTAGWQVVSEVGTYEIELSSFQPPMDRTQIQIRRMAHVDRLLDEPLLPWYVASLLGHTEPVGFQLTSRQERKVSAEIFLWIVGHELLPQRDVVANLWPLSRALSPSDAREDQLVFLLSESFRQLREDRVDIIRTVAEETDAVSTGLLTRLGFRQSGTGQVWRWQVDGAVGETQEGSESVRVSEQAGSLFYRRLHSEIS